MFYNILVFYKIHLIHSEIKKILASDDINFINLAIDLIVS